MKYQRLLFSRSLEQDYRWMVIPSEITSADMNLLRRLYDTLDHPESKRFFSQSTTSPIYCLNTQKLTFLVTFGPSGYEDKEGRSVYCLQGISVTQRYKRHFAFILPWLLAYYGENNLLNIWDDIDYLKEADELNKQVSKDFTFNLDDLDEAIAKLVTTSKSYQKEDDELLTRKLISLSYDRNGLKSLFHFVSSTNIFLFDFAFGATQELVRDFETMRIVALIPHLARADRRSTRTPNLLEDQPRQLDKLSNIVQEPEPEPEVEEDFGDPLDRFNPRKKDVEEEKVSEEDNPNILSFFNPKSYFPKRQKGEKADESKDKN